MLAVPWEINNNKKINKNKPKFTINCRSSLVWLASQIGAITGEELSLSVLSFSDKLVPWSPLGWEGGAQFYSSGAPCWGREGELPQRCESVQALAYRGSLSPAGADFREVSWSVAHQVCSHPISPARHRPRQLQRNVSVCSRWSHRSSHSITTRLLLSCLLSVLCRCMCWFLTQNWGVRVAVAQHRRCLALNSQTWSRGRCVSELSCVFLQFSLHVYNIAINSTGEEIPSKNVAYSYQAMS